MADIPTQQNNPGDLKENGSIATFPTPQEGYGALLNDLQSKISGKSKTGLNGNSTLADFSNTYAPSSDDNNPAQYTANLANQLKVPPNTKLSALQPKIGQFAEAVAKNEGYDPTDVSQSTTQSTSKSPSLTDYLLGGGSALLAGGLSYVKNNAGNIAGDIGKDALTDAAVGTAVEPGGGTLVGGGIGVVQGIVDSLFGGNKSSDATGSTDTTSGVLNPTTNNEAETESDQEGNEDIQRIEDAQKATAALSATLQTTPTGKLLASQPQNQEALGYMAQNGFIPDTSSGVNDFSGAMKQNAQNRSELSNGVAQVLDMGGEKASLDDVRQRAYANIEKYADVREQPQQKALVDKELAQYKEHYGNEVSLGNLERSKREQGMAKGDWQKDTPSRNGHKALYGAFRDTITNNTKHKDLYNKVMKEETKSFQADKLMKKMNGKKALEHKGILRGVLKSYGKYIGTYLGDKIGGPIGAIVGTMVGDYVEKRVDKKFGKTFFESKEGKKLMDMVGKKSPRAKKMLEQEIEKYEKEGEEKVKQHLDKEGIIKQRHQEWQKERQELKKKGLLKQDTQKKRKGFIPSNEWQEVPKGATLPNGLTFKMDMKTGKNYARKG